MERSLESVPNQAIYNNYISSIDKQTIGTDKSNIRAYNIVSSLQTSGQILDRPIAVFTIEPKQCLYTTNWNKSLQVFVRIQD